MGGAVSVEGSLGVWGWVVGVLWGVGFVVVVVGVGGALVVVVGVVGGAGVGRWVGGWRLVAVHVLVSVGGWVDDGGGGGLSSMERQ